MKSTYCLSLVVLMLAIPVAAQESSEPEEDRVTFNFTISEERGGGKATLIAGDFEYQEGLYVIATGGVDFKYQGLRLQADRARIDIPTNLLTAEGNVILDEGAQRLVGETVQYDLNTRTGRVTDATAYVEGDYYFTGSQIAKTGETTYTVDDGIFTACEQDVPSWSIHMSDARITLEEYARMKNARLKFKKLPVFYAPYIVWPANTERASGLLVPKPGYSERRGAELSLAYFKTLGRSADTTFLLDVSTEEYLGFGNETRYRPSERTDGVFRFYALSEPDNARNFNNFTDASRQQGDTRWKVELQHETRDLWGGFRGVVNFQEYSDLDYLLDYERNADNQRRSFVYSNAFLTRNFGQQSFNVMVDQRERILSSGNKDIRRQLPEVEYSLRPTKLGNTPMYLSFATSLHYFSLERQAATEDQISASEEYGRVDFFPTLSVPLSTLPWLSAKVDLSGRATYYTESLKPEGDPEEGQFGGGSLTRFFPQAGLEIIGPSFSRIFNRKSGAKLKHIIEPRMTYAFVDDFDEQADIPLFDEIDRLRPINGWLFSLVNRFMSKPAGDEGSAVEVASVTLSQGLSLDSAQPGQQSRTEPTVQSDEGPLAMALRVNPSQATSMKLDLGFNTLFDSYDITSLRLSGSTRLGPHDFQLSWFSNWSVDLAASDLIPSEDDPEVLVPLIPIADRAVLSTKTSEQVRLATKLALVPNKLSLHAELSFDVLGQLRDPTDPDLGRSSWDLLQQRYFLNWQSQCYSWQLEYRESNFRAIEDRDVRFSLTLKNVGTFLDLNDSL